jgi:hypothetical protein
MDPVSRRTRHAGQGNAAAVQTKDLFEVVYRRGPETWTFRYTAGEEAAMVEAVRQVMREDRGLDWVDVALIAHEIRTGRAVDIVR